MVMPDSSELPSLPPLVPEADLQARVAELAGQVNADITPASP